MCRALCAACTTAPRGDGTPQGGAALIQAVQSPAVATGAIAVSMSPKKANDLLTCARVVLPATATGSYGAAWMLDDGGAWQTRTASFR